MRQLVKLAIEEKATLYKLSYKDNTVKYSLNTIVGKPIEVTTMVDRGKPLCMKALYCDKTLQDIHTAELNHLGFVRTLPNG